MGTSDCVEVRIASLSADFPRRFDDCQSDARGVARPLDDRQRVLARLEAVVFLQEATDRIRQELLFLVVVEVHRLSPRGPASSWK